MQQVKIPHRKTLVLAGFEQVRSTLSDRGTGKPKLPILGGGHKSSQERRDHCNCDYTNCIKFRNKLMNTEKIESNSIDKNNVDKSEFNLVLVNDVNAEVTPNHGTVKVGKLVFAVELHWELTTSLAKAKQEARKRAGEPHFLADFCCVRRGTTQQFALGFRTSGHRLKMPVISGKYSR